MCVFEISRHGFVFGFFGLLLVDAYAPTYRFLKQPKTMNEFTFTVVSTGGVAGCL